MKGNRLTSSHDGLRESKHARRASVQLVIRPRIKNSYREAELGGKAFEFFFY